jgi:hypothetical protein
MCRPAGTLLQVRARGPMSRRAMVCSFGPRRVRLRCRCDHLAHDGAERPGKPARPAGEDAGKESHPWERRHLVRAL